MRASRLLGSVGLCAVALSAPSSVVGRPAEATSWALVDAARRAGTLGPAEASLLRVQAARDPSRLPVAFTGLPSAPGHALTPELFSAFLGRRSLGSAQQRSLAALLARPTDPGDPYRFSGEEEPPHCSEHFCFHWVTTGADALRSVDADGDGVPELIELARDALEDSFEKLIGLGYSLHGIDDGLAGGDARIDVYFKDAGQGFAAAVFPEALVESTPVRLSSFVMVNLQVVTQQMPADYLREVLSHELKHVFDAATFGNAPAWLFESSAVWVEDQVNDRARFHTVWFPCWYDAPGVSLDPPRDFAYASGRCAGQSTHIYGSATYWFHLTARFGVDLQRQVWDEGGRDCPDEFLETDGATHRACVAGVIERWLARRGETHREAFTAFAVDNLAPRQSAVLLQVESAGELAAWPSAPRFEASVRGYPAQGELALPHLSAGYVRLVPPAGLAGTLTVQVTPLDDDAPRGHLVAVSSGGRTLLESSGGPGSATWVVPSFGTAVEEAQLALVNADSVVADGSSDGRRTRWTASFELSPPPDAGVGGGAGEAGTTGDGAADGPVEAAPPAEGGGCGCRLPTGVGGHRGMAGALLVPLLVLGRGVARRRRPRLVRGAPRPLATR